MINQDHIFTHVVEVYSRADIPKAARKLINAKNPAFLDNHHRWIMVKWGIKRNMKRTPVDIIVGTRAMIVKATTHHTPKLMIHWGTGRAYGILRLRLGLWKIQRCYSYGTPFDPIVGHKWFNQTTPISYKEAKRQLNMYVQRNMLRHPSQRVSLRMIPVRPQDQKDSDVPYQYAPMNRKFGKNYFGFLFA